MPRARAGVPHRELFWRTGHYRVVLVDGWKLQVNERPSLTENPVNVDKTLAEPDAPDDEYVYWPN